MNAMPHTRTHPALSVLFLICIFGAAFLFSYSSDLITKMLAAGAFALAFYYFARAASIGAIDAAQKWSPWFLCAGIAILSLSTLIPSAASMEPFIAAITFVCAAAFWFNRARSARHIEEEYESESRAEARRKEDFPARFPRIARVPFVRALMRTLYTEGWLYSIGLIVLIAFSASLLSYNLGARNFYEDEYQVVAAATSYYHGDGFYQWDWLAGTSAKDTGCVNTADCSYERAWPHTWLVALSYSVFGISEWSSRIVSVVFGVLFVPIFYFVARFFTENKRVALMAAAIGSVYPSYDSLFRYTRMYALLIPLFTLLSYLSYRALVGDGSKAFLSGLRGFLRRNLNLQYGFLAAAFLLLAFLYFVHINALILVPSAFVFCLLMLALTRERTWLTLSAIGVLGILGVASVYLLGLTNKFLAFFSFFGVNNLAYLDYVARYPFETNAGCILLLGGTVSLGALPARLRYKLLYLYSIVGFSLFFFIYIGNRYSSFTYISHVTALAIILMLFFAYMAVGLLRSRTAAIISVLFLAALVGTQFIRAAPGLYEASASAQFTKAYAPILEHYRPGKDVIMGQYLRAYYLRSLAGEKVLTVNMLSNKQYTFEMFAADAQKYGSGYVTWETRKSYHLSPAVAGYIKKHFTHLSGTGVDASGVEVYYFDQTMLADLRSGT